MFRLVVVACLALFANNASAVSFPSCDSLPEFDEFVDLIKEARACKVDSDCVVQHFKGYPGGYGLGAPVNRRSLEFLESKEKSLPRCMSGFCECFIMELDAVLCVENLCTAKIKPFVLNESFK